MNKYRAYLDTKSGDEFVVEIDKRNFEKWFIYGKKGNYLMIVQNHNNVKIKRVIPGGNILFMDEIKESK